MECERLSDPVSVPAAQRSYDPTHYPHLFAIEDRHFWFRARNQIIALLMGQLIRELPPGYRVLEVGCGTGNVLRVLEQVCARGRVLGMDLHMDGLCYARQRVTCPLVQGDVHRPPLGTNFELIGLFDTLEHLPDDAQVLHDLYGMLRHGGVLLLTVPAHHSLWSYFDVSSGHRRRYELAELVTKLTDVGYLVEYSTEYMATLFPFIWLERRLATLLNRRTLDKTERRHEQAHRELSIRKGVNELFGFLLTQEARVLASRRTLPIGTSLLAIARRPA